MLDMLKTYICMYFGGKKRVNCEPIKHSMAPHLCIFLALGKVNIYNKYTVQCTVIHT